MKWISLLGLVLSALSLLVHFCLAGFTDDSISDDIIFSWRPVFDNPAGPARMIHFASSISPTPSPFLPPFSAEKDTNRGTGWERFEFDKDAPVDDEEVEEGHFRVNFYTFSMISLYNRGNNDDAALVKRMGQSFRFNAIEIKDELRRETLQASKRELGE